MFNLLNNLNIQTKNLRNCCPDMYNEPTRHVTYNVNDEIYVCICIDCRKLKWLHFKKKYI